MKRRDDHAQAARAGSRAALRILVLLLATPAALAAADIAPPLIDAVEAAALINGGGDLIVLDAGWPEDHERRRVRGAVPVGYGDWLRRNRRDPAAPEFLARWRDDLAALGIGADTRVLIHGGRGSYNAPATVWYALQGIGVADLSVVDGGFEALAAALPGAWLDLAPLPQGPPSPPPPPPHPFVPVGEPVHFAPAFKNDVTAALADGGTVLLDARSEQEFAGQDGGRNPRPGRIPGSRNLPHGRVRTDDGRVLPRQDIVRLLAEQGIAPGDRLLVSCQGGGRSAFLALALAHAGFRDVRNYFGSFGEWSRDPDRPVEAAGTAGPRPLD